MKINRLQKRIMIFLIVLCLLTPAGILLPVVFDAGDAWGEWSAHTLKEMTGYVPAGLAKYIEIWDAPLDGYDIRGTGSSLHARSGKYIITGIFGATLSYLIMLLISGILMKHEK